MQRRWRVRLAAALAIGMSFSAAPVNAQQEGQKERPRGEVRSGPSVPPPGSPASSEPARYPPDPRERRGEQQRRPARGIGVLLSGKVVMEDGTPPPDSAVVETVCNGIARPEGYTDDKGSFSIRLGQKTHTVADATLGSWETWSGDIESSLPAGSNTPFSASSGRHLIGCELRASLPGYRSNVIPLSGRRRIDNPDVGTIVLRRVGGVEGTTISASSLQAPKAAKKAYEKGRKALSKSKWAEGQRQLEKAVQIHPKYAAAWFELGMALEQQGKLDEARKAHRQAIASDAKFVKPYLQLAAIAARERNWQEVANNTELVLKLDPFHFAVAYFYNSAANYNLKKLDAAEKSAREALKLDRKHRFPKVLYLLGVILAEKGDWSGAAEHMRSYLRLVPDAPDRQVVQKRLSEIEKLLGSTAYSRPRQ